MLFWRRSVVVTLTRWGGCVVVHKSQALSLGVEKWHNKRCQDIVYVPLCSDVSPPPRTGTSCVLKFSYSPLHHDVAPTKVKNLLRCTYEHILHVCIPWSHHHTFPSQMWNGLRKWQIFTAPAVIWRAHLPIEVCSGRGLTEGVGQAGMDVFIPSDDVNSFQRSVSVR